MPINWKSVEGSQEQKPKEVDQESSKSTVYLRKNIEQIEKEDESGDKISVWIYEEAQLSRKEYEEYKQIAQIFTMPEYEELKGKVEDQQITLAEVAVNSEYSVCLQELSM